MGQKYGPEKSYEERKHRHMQVVYAQQTHERRVFMQDLKDIRLQSFKRMFGNVRTLVGPTWYQVLSVPQRNALDMLEISIYSDILEGMPTRVAVIMKKLGIFPRPRTTDLMNCVYLGRDDPKEMFAQYFQVCYGHPIEGKRASYNLNARLLLSAIFYLGLRNLIHLLQERFKPDTKETKQPPKPKPKPGPPLASPYLQEMIAVLYSPPSRKKPRPLPLPNLDDLDEPYEEEPMAPKPIPPPPPPPPPKKRLPLSYCEKLAGIMPIEAHRSLTALSMKTTTRKSLKRLRGSNVCLTEVKKTYGICITRPKKGSRRKKLVAPSTGLWNAQYLVNGIFKINGKTIFVLGSVSILPASGDLIHGGFKSSDGQYINVHCGFRGFPPPPKPDHCDCVKQWHEPVFKYMKETKCYCGHYYDYGNEGNFPQEDLLFFEKPTRDAPYSFNYNTIFDIDERSILIDKEFKRLWDTDSVLHEDDGKDKKDKKKKKLKRSSTTCLGEHPKPEDYLKCALRLMRRVNIAAKLPDVHLTSELKEWMRRRIYGSLTDAQKKEYLRKSSDFFQMFFTLANRSFGHVATPKEAMFMGHTNWMQKTDLNKKFNRFTMQYRIKLFRSIAYMNNLLWPAMFQAQFPDKKFREIFFSYLNSTMEDITLMHPYSAGETDERKCKIMKRRYICLPAGIEPEE